MSIRTLNVGILAHVDAGKTSLTERLLFDNGAISDLGSVDAGSTQTDTGELERRRGITIRTAVASFALGELQVNLVDTPGHPDFIAEVERALSVLDGVVLVVSAVEGVQAQTRVLMRSLERMRLPTLVFVNKIDRMGARYDSLLAEIRRRLTPAAVAMQRVEEPGTPRARVVARSLHDETFATEVAGLLVDNDDALLARVVDQSIPAREELRDLLEEQTTAGLVHPVLFGSALTGAGTVELADAVRALLGRRPPEGGEDLHGTVFAIERGSQGEKIAYLRLFSGVLHVRQRVTFHRRGSAGVVEEHSGRITGLEVVGAGGRGSGVPSRPGPLTPGNIARLRGLPGIRVGDRLGDRDGGEAPARFPLPVLESVVRARRPGRETELHAALTRLADEDPLIRTRAAGGGATSVLLYGAVQREVIAERLEREFGVEAVFEEVQPVYVERPAGVGEAVSEFEPRGPNEFWQTVGLRIEPAAPGAGNTVTPDVERGLLPGAYHRAIEEAVTATLHQGLHGWEVTDASVTLTRVGYEPPLTTAADFRNLAPIVLMRALGRAGSNVYEPGYAIEVEIPHDSLSGVSGLLAALGADNAQPTEVGSAWTVRADIPARSLRELAVALPGLTHGEGTVAHAPGDDRRVRGPLPVRARSDRHRAGQDHQRVQVAGMQPGRQAT